MKDNQNPKQAFPQEPAVPEPVASQRPIQVVEEETVVPPPIQQPAVEPQSTVFESGASAQAPQAPFPIQQNESSAPPPAPPGETPQKGFSLPPLKFILIGLGAIVLLGLVGFLIQKFFFSKPTVSKITLTYWGLEEKTVIDPLIREYEAQNPNVQIQYLNQSKDDYRERLVNSLAKNAGPDIFRFHNTWVPMMSSHLAPSTSYDAASFSNTFFPTATRDLVRGSAPLGIPLMFDGLGLYINETIFSNSEKLIPANWDDLRTVAHELTIKDTEGRIEQSGIALGRTENVDYWQDILSLMLLQNKADLENPVGSLAGDPVLYFASFSQGDMSTWDDTLPTSTQAFIKGNLAMYFGPAASALKIRQANPNLQFRVVPVPQLPKNSPSDPDITFASYWAEGVWARSKNAAESWKFLKFLSEKSSLEKLYSTSIAINGYGNPYPRADMAESLANDPIVGAYLRLAPNAKASYLVADTYDGNSGINSKISMIWKTVLDAVIKERGNVETLLPIAAEQIKQVLGSYN